MHGTRTAIGSLVLLSLLALPAATVGQDTEQRVVDADVPVYVTWEGAPDYMFSLGVPTEAHAWGERSYGGLRVGTKASDPRISGEQVWVYGDDRSTSSCCDGLSRTSSLMRLETEVGAWQGLITEVVLPGNLTVQYGWLTGEGAYEGLSYFYHYHDDTASDVRTGDGVIWPGPPLPAPEPALLDADPLD